jgi:hypothetical protein
MMAKPTDERPRLEPDDLRWAARACAEALAPALDRDWRVRAGELDWDAYTTLDHVVGAMGFYAVNLAMRATVEVPFVTRSLASDLISADPRVPATRLVAALEAMAAVLADVARAAPAGARGWHGYGLADVEGFIAMGCDEILVHTDDMARGLGLTWQPPEEELCRRILARLFPWAPAAEEPWSTLRWANGRTALAGHPQLGPDWAWQSAPLSEWDGSIRKTVSPETA